MFLRKNFTRSLSISMTFNFSTLLKIGIVKEVCVEDGQPVEFDQKIAILD